MARSRLEALAHAAGCTVGTTWRLLRARRVEATRAKVQEESLSSQRLIEGARARAKARAEARARGTADAGATLLPSTTAAPRTEPAPAAQSLAALQSAQYMRDLDEPQVMQLPATRPQDGEPLSLLPGACPAVSLTELETAVYALVNGEIADNEPAPETESVLQAESPEEVQAVMPMSNPDLCSEAESLLAWDEAPLIETPSGPTVDAPSNASTPEEAPEDPVEPPNPAPRVKSGQLEGVPGNLNDGLATLPVAADEVAARTYLIPPPPVASVPRWFRPDEIVTVAGIVLPGMVRVGASSAAGRPLHDPSMIGLTRSCLLTVHGQSALCSTTVRWTTARWLLVTEVPT